MSAQEFDTITGPVKLVIWDLDDTFWKGTLSEGGIRPIAGNLDLVPALVDRGIMVSICSRNDRAAAQAELEALGVWDLFVLPHVDWTPKGRAIARLIGRMGLRAENVLFIDDDPLNQEEAAFFNPGLATLDGRLDLGPLLDLPALRGKDDRARERLAQYKVLEAREDQRDASGLSNEAFLRSSEVRVRLVTDLEGRMDRVHEILNRTNQLNFTKVRANTEAEREALRAMLATPGVHAGLVEVRDRFGDYGDAGFFCLRRRASGTTLHHFAFSCRTMDMGVEQWLWQRLERPAVAVVQPVASRLDPDRAVDWITEVKTWDGAPSGPDRHVCLVGGCDLQQVSLYCGTRRDEFVNRQDAEGRLVRYDDPAFIATPREAGVRSSLGFTTFAGWTLEDMKGLDRSLAQADLVILSLFPGFSSDMQFGFGDGEGGRYRATIPPARFRSLMRDPAAAVRFVKQMRYRPFVAPERLDQTEEALGRARSLMRPDATLFVLGAITDRGKQAERTGDLRRAYNRMIRAVCERHAGIIFVDLDSILNDGDIVDSDHYTRTGYFRIARSVTTMAEAATGPITLAA